MLLLLAAKPSGFNLSRWEFCNKKTKLVGVFAEKISKTILHSFHIWCCLLRLAGVKGKGEDTGTCVSTESTQQMLQTSSSPNAAPPDVHLSLLLEDAVGHISYFWAISGETPRLTTP